MTFDLRTKFDGEAFFLIQTQSAAQTCIGWSDVVFDITLSTVDAENQVQDDGTVDDAGVMPPPDFSVPADPALVRKLRDLQMR